MPEATQAPEGTTGQEPAPADPQVGNVEVPQDGEHEGSSSITDVVTLQRELSKAQKQAAASRSELKAIKDAEATKEAATQTEAQRLARHVAELEAKQKELETRARLKTLEAAVAKQALLLGIIDPDVAVKLLDTDDLDIDDETGEPKNIEAALKALIKAKPYLAKQPDTATPGSINGAAGAQAGPAPKLTADELAAATESGMTPERYAALKGVKTLADWQKAQPAKH